MNTAAASVETNRVGLPMGQVLEASTSFNCHFALCCMQKTGRIHTVSQATLLVCLTICGVQGRVPGKIVDGSAVALQHTLGSYAM